MATSTGTTLTLIVAMNLAFSVYSAKAQETQAVCPAVQVMPRAMKIGTQYARGDPSYSQIDPQAVLREKGARASISTSVSRIAQLADRWRKADGSQRPGIAACLQRHFLAQADAEALMGARSVFDAYYREWMLASLAISYRKAKSGLEGRPGTDRVQAWFRVSGQQIKQFNEGQMKLGRIDNHRYWGALASMTLGQAANDPALVAFGRRIRAIGLDAVRKDGTLESEMKREARAFHYHLFAATALAALVTLDPKPAPDNEVDAIQRLTHVLIQHIGSPKNSVFQRMTGMVQVQETHPAMAYALYPFVLSSPDRDQLDKFLLGTVARYQFLGGDLDFMKSMKKQ